MSFDDIDEYTVMLADAYAKDAYAQGYAKGFKAGKHVGSKEAYNHFFRDGHWEGEISYEYEDYCPLCASYLGEEGGWLDEKE